MVQRRCPRDRKFADTGKSLKKLESWRLAAFGLPKTARQMTWRS